MTIIIPITPFAMGIMICTNILSSLAPSIFAASAYVLETVLNRLYAMRNIIPKGVAYCMRINHVSIIFRSTYIL